MVNSTPSILQIHGKFYYSHFFDQKNDGKFYSFYFSVKISIICCLVSLLTRFELFLRNVQNDQKNVKNGIKGIRLGKNSKMTDFGAKMTF